MNRIGIAVCCAAMLGVATVAGATSLMHLEDREMALQSETIVVGRCASATTEWVEGTLVTKIRIEVSETLKGAATRELTLAIPGGVDTNRPVPVSVMFPGAPSVVRDETVLLYLESSGLVRDGYGVTGFNQGKYSVVDVGGKQYVVRDGEQPISLQSKRAAIATALAGN